MFLPIIRLTPFLLTNFFLFCYSSFGNNSNLNHYSWKTELATRLDNPKYLYLPVPSNVIDRIWKAQENHINRLNQLFKARNLYQNISFQGRILNNQLTKRPALAIKGQPFHDLPVHISIRYEDDANNKSPSLKEIQQRLQSLYKINPQEILMDAEIVKILLVSVSRNGSLSLMAFLKTSENTQKILNRIVLESGQKLKKRSQLFHITFGQTLFPPELAQIVWNFNLEYGNPMRFLDKNPAQAYFGAKHGSVKSMLNVFSESKRSFKKFLYDSRSELEKMGFKPQTQDASLILWHKARN